MCCMYLSVFDIYSGKFITNEIYYIYVIFVTKLTVVAFNNKCCSQHCFILCQQHIKPTFKSICDAFCAFICLVYPGRPVSSLFVYLIAGWLVARVNRHCINAFLSIILHCTLPLSIYIYIWKKDEQDFIYLKTDDLRWVLDRQKIYWIMCIHLIRSVE